MATDCDCGSAPLHLMACRVNDADKQPDDALRDEVERKVLAAWARPGTVDAAVQRVAAVAVEKVREARLRRDREWSNRLESQDTMHPDSPDLDVAIAWYVSQKRAPAPKEEA